MDLDMALSCFHADSVHDHGKFHGFSQDFCKHAMALVAELDHTQHHISNVSVELVGDIAHTEAYFWLITASVQRDGHRFLKRVRARMFSLGDVIGTDLSGGPERGE